MTEYIASVQCTLYGNAHQQPVLHWCNMVCNVFMQTGKQCVIAIYQRMHCRVMKQKKSGQI
ncbi:MAG: hypothetical protein E7K36_19100 [Bacteroides sp.]|nr:hypothetical protein [Bacteroides sp.]